MAAFSFDTRLPMTCANQPSNQLIPLREVRSEESDGIRADAENTDKLTSVVNDR